MKCPGCKCDPAARTALGACDSCGYPIAFPTDGGTFDLGIERDPALDRRNDMHVFSEEWIGMSRWSKDDLIKRLLDPPT